MTLSTFLSKDEIMKLITIKMKQRYLFFIHELDCKKIDTIIQKLYIEYYK